MPSHESFSQYFANFVKQKQWLITETVVPSQVLRKYVTCSNMLALVPTDSRQVYKIVSGLKDSNYSGYESRHYLCNGIVQVT